MRNTWEPSSLQHVDESESAHKRGQHEPKPHVSNAQVDKVLTGLDQALAATQYAEQGRPQGKVVLVVDPALK